MKKLVLGMMLSVLFPVFASAEEVIVRMRDNVSLMAISSMDVKFIKEVRGSEQTFVVEGNLKDLQINSAVLYAEPNYILHALVTEEEPAPEAGAWGVSKIQAPEAWKTGVKGEGVVVAVIDTGVDYTHPALAGKVWMNEKEIAGNNLDDDGNGFIDDVYGYDFANKDGDPKDDHSHGTHCSGTIVGDKVGVAPKAKIMAIKFLDKNGSGTLAAAVEAINYATLMKANVMSNSWGGGGFSQTMADAIKKAQDAGIVFVAAAGNEYNDNDKRPTYPATYDGVIAVAATDDKDAKASFSNWGATKVAVAAPGVKIYSTVIDGKYASYSGTSMACPHVAGMSALLLSKGIPAAEVKQKLIDSSDLIDSLTGKSVSNGRVNALKAVN